MRLCVVYNISNAQKLASKQGKKLDGFIRGDIADPFGNRIELMQRV